MTTRRVSWRRSDEVEADEWCTLSVRDNGLSLVGTVVGAVDALPLRVEYRVFAEPGGMTTAVHVREWHGFEQRALTLSRDGKGNWTRDGRTDRKLKGCTDVDLGISPATNTLPIRRLRTAVGASSSIKAAWVRFPELSVEKTGQTYTRIDEATWRYASGSFEAELVVDEDGLVASYAVWRRTGLAIGADDSEPLDAVR
ncbi:MAG TPA: putative glycolipid-binding domain-containing protein [Candidatus Limnocylindrales bacterium]